MELLYLILLGRLLAPKILTICPCPWRYYMEKQQILFYISEHVMKLEILRERAQPGAYACVCAYSGVTNSVACQVPLSMEFFRQRVLEWVAISSSRGSSQSRDRILAGRFFTSEPPGKPWFIWMGSNYSYTHPYKREGQTHRREDIFRGNVMWRRS